MSNFVTGLTTYAPESGAVKLVATQNERLWTFDGSAIMPFTGATISNDNLTFMQQAINPQASSSANSFAIYGTDKVNKIFKFDGTALTEPNSPGSLVGILIADGVTPLTGVTDLLWFMDRMWYAKGDYIYFSEVGNPEYIVNAPLACRKGAGDRIIKLMSYRNGIILAFKGGDSGVGSIHSFDVSSNDPEFFIGETVPLFDKLSITSPHSIVRLSSNTDSDILYWTREGYRSLNWTALDKLTGPSLPLTNSIPDIINTINYPFIETAHASVFDDEILLWVPTGNSLSPNICLGNSRKIPGNSPQNGWVKYDMMPATCSTIAAIGNDKKPCLYIGTADGQIQKAFANFHGTHTCREVSKRIDYDQWDKDKGPLKIFVTQDGGASGTMRLSLLFENDEERPLNDQVFGQGGVEFPIVFPVAFAFGGIESEPRDLHYDANKVAMRRFKDIRFKMETEGFPRMLGYTLQSTIEQYRYAALNKDTAAAVEATAYTQPEMAAANYEG